jgi:hypothetical protein
MNEEPSILLVGGREGEQLLLNEAFSEYNALKVKIYCIYDVEEALRYLKVRSERQDFPPPYAIIIRSAMTGVAGCALLKYIKEVEWLEGIPHFVLIHHRMIGVTECPKIVETCYINEPERWQQYEFVVKLIMDAIKQRWYPNPPEEKGIDNPTV